MTATLCYQDVPAEHGRSHQPDTPSPVRRPGRRTEPTTGRSGGTLDGAAAAAPWGEAGTTRPGNLRARTRQLTSQAYEGIAVHRNSLPGESQGNSTLRPAAVPPENHGIDPR